MSDNRPFDAIMRNIGAFMRDNLVDAGYDPDDPDLVGKMEADDKTLLRFRCEWDA